MNENWTSKPLGEVMTLQRGFDLPKKERKEGLVPIISSSGSEDFHAIAAKKGPGVITGRYGTIGKVFYTKTPYWPLNTTLFVSNFHGNHPKYCYYLLSRFNFNEHSGKTGVPGVNRNDLHTVSVELTTDPNEQEAIAEALSDTDALIEGLEQLVAKKRLIKQGAMQELLTGKRRLPEFSGEWIETKLGSLLTVKHGRSQKEVESRSGIYPILATGGQIGNANSFLWNKPSVLIGRKGTIDRPQFVETPFWTVDTLFYTDIHHPNNPRFLFYIFQRIDWQSYNEASGVPSLNAKTIEGIDVIVPLPDEQSEISNLLKDMDAEIQALETRLEKARQMKEGMMQNLLTGRIRLV